MTNLTSFNQTPQPAEAIPGYVLNKMLAVEAESDNFETWIATLTRLAEEHERRARVAENLASHSPSNTRSEAGETKPPLQKVADGPWRSLGGYFDYSLWPDRERFMELDRAIAAAQELREPEVEHHFDAA